MTELDTYLRAYFLNDAQLSTAAGIGTDAHDALMRDGLVPEPSYVVTNAGKVGSFVFGQMDAPGSAPGRYFHPAQVAWISRARQVLASGPAADARQRLKAQFTANFAAALATLNLTVWRLPDSFDQHGASIADGLGARTGSAWTYFLNGTFGLCVANPISEAHIACKEVLQEKLTQLSQNGSRTQFSPDEAESMSELVDSYAAAAMPFSPVEYSRSSRKRLVEDLRAHIAAAQGATAAAR
jgi:hypothetical protein